MQGPRGSVCSAGQKGCGQEREGSELQLGQMDPPSSSHEPSTAILQLGACLLTGCLQKGLILLSGVAAEHKA